MTRRFVEIGWQDKLTVECLQRSPLAAVTTAEGNPPTALRIGVPDVDDQERTSDRRHPQQLEPNPVDGSLGFVPVETFVSLKILTRREC